MKYIFSFITLASLLPCNVSQNLGSDSLQSLNNVDLASIVNTPVVSSNEERNLMGTSDIRFNKFTGDPRGFKPLVAAHYPVYGNVYDVLTGMTDAMDIVMLNDRKVVDIDVMGIIEKLGGLPVHPEANVHSWFWDELREVIDIQEMRKHKPLQNLIPLPELWKNYTLDDCAKAVHNEEPGSIQKAYLNALLNGKWGHVHIDPEVFPASCYVSLNYYKTALQKTNSWIIDTVMPPTFAAKWYAGRSRPEEVIWAIKKGRIWDGVPSDIKNYVNYLNPQQPYDFTAYDEGCPKHPSWPAMHAASGTCSLWMAVMMDFNDEQLCQARLTDYAIAYSRTIAGVHYPDDNIMGLNFAQEVIGQALPAYLRDNHGADAHEVARKVEAFKFDWNTFDPDDPCPFLHGRYDKCYHN